MEMMGGVELLSLLDSLTTGTDADSKVGGQNQCIPDSLVDKATRDDALSITDVAAMKSGWHLCGPQRGPTPAPC